MDPQQTWTDMLNALTNKEWDEAKELADALHEWLRQGGFPPTTVGDSSLGQQWHKTIAPFTCLAIANKADDVRKQRRKRQAKKERRCLMLHADRVRSVSEVSSAEELARNLTETTWCCCQAFRIAGHPRHFWLNDSTAEDGAQEYSVLKLGLAKADMLQIESITFGCCGV